MDIRIKADVVPFLNRLFIRRMIGTLDDYKWEKWAGLKDLIREKETPLDPALFKRREAPEAPDKAEESATNVKPAPEENTDD